MSIFKTFVPLAVVLILTAGSVFSDPASWSSFIDSAITGITVSPSLASNVFDYTVSLDSAPTVTFGGITYNVVWVQAWYIVSFTGNENFTATPGYAPPDWKWESKTTPGRIVGWQGQGSERVYPGQSKFFTFTTFDITNMPVVEGYHLGYVNPGDGMVYTAWFKNTVPEPGSIAALAIGLSALIAIRRRK